MIGLIVIIGLILVTLSLIFHPSIAKTREPKDEQLCITVHTIYNNIYVMLIL